MPKPKRNYKKEYKEYQGKPEQIKYRSGLVKENRKRGTYGNGDGLDVSHSNGRKSKVKGLESPATNRSRKPAGFRGPSRKAR